MSDIYKIAVRLTMESNAGGVLTTLAGMLTGLESKVGKLESSFRGLNRAKLAFFGAAGIAGGVGIISVMGKVAEHGKDLLDQQDKLRRLNMDNNEILKATANYYQNVARAVPTSNAADYLKTVRELRAVTGSWGEAANLAPTALKFDALLANLKETKGGAGQGYSEFYKVLRSAEMKGISTDPGKLKEYTDDVFSFIQAFGGKLDANAFQLLAKRGGTSFARADLKKALGAIAVMAADKGGETAGTALMTLQQFQQGAGVLSKQQYATLSDAGLIDQSRVIQQGFGKVQLKPGALKGSLQYDGDLPDWAQLVLRPAILALAKRQAAHDHMPDKWESYFNSDWAKILTNRNAAGAAMMFSDPGFVDQRMKDLGLAGSAWNVDKSYNSFINNDPKGVEEGFWGQYDSMMQAIGSPLMQEALPVMKAVTAFFSDVGEFANKHPDAIKNIGIGFGVLASALTAAGVAAIVAAIGPVGWVAAGISALAAVFKSFAPKSFDEWLAGLKTLAHGIITFNWSEVAGGLAQELKATFGKIPGLLSGAIAQMGQDIANAIADVFRSILDKLKNFQLHGAAGGMDQMSYSGGGVGGGIIRASYMQAAGANDNASGGGYGGLPASAVIDRYGSGGGGFNTRGVRNMNPGNIGYGAWARAHGATGSAGTDTGHGVAVFPSFEAGYAAMGMLALGKYRSGRRSIDSLIAGANGWTPGNHDAAANVARMMGISAFADAHLDNPEMMAKFKAALSVQELGPAGARYARNHTRISAPPGSRSVDIHVHNHLDGKVLSHSVIRHQIEAARFPTAVGGVDPHGNYASPGTPLDDVA